MYRIALNTAITTLRKFKRRPQQVGLDETIKNTLKFDDDSGDDDIELLHRAIKKLNPVERALILLYLEDLSHKEIAEVLGLTVSNVGVKLSRIKSKLQGFVQRQES
jgi:RNA polymerase sigma-70 factor (ECF subfamily)